ncbi:hypothetical protein D3C72_2273610 [compost metagenome]
MAYIRFQADAGKKIQQQCVAYLQLEFDLDVEAVVEQGSYRCADEATDDRFGNAVLAQQGGVLDDGLAEKQQHDGEREAHETMNRKKLGGHR